MSKQASRPVFSAAYAAHASRLQTAAFNAATLAHTSPAARVAANSAAAAAKRAVGHVIKTL